MLVLLISIICFSSPQGRKRKVKIIGTVIAYDRSVTQLLKLTSVPAEEIFIVRDNKGPGVKRESLYIKVTYQRWLNEPDVPKEFFDSKKQWQLDLAREPRCDGPLRELLEMKGKTERGDEVSLPRLQRTKGAEDLEIPGDINLPCYVLCPGSLKLYVNKR